MCVCVRGRGGGHLLVFCQPFWWEGQEGWEGAGMFAGIWAYMCVCARAHVCVCMHVCVCAFIINQTKVVSEYNDMET